MGSLLNTAVYIGPVVLLLGLLAAISCLTLQLFGPGKRHVARRALVTTGLCVASYAIRTLKANREAP